MCKFNMFITAVCVLFLIKSSIVSLEAPLSVYLRPSIIYSVPCDQIMQRPYFECPTEIRLCSQANKITS